MRVEARRALIVDSAIGLILAVTSWIASFYVWGRAEFNRPDWGHGPPGRVITTVDSSPWVLPAVILLALGIATRRVWPRAAFVATVMGVGTYLATGAMFGPIFLALHLACTRWQAARTCSPTKPVRQPPTRPYRHCAVGRRC